MTEEYQEFIRREEEQDRAERQRERELDLRWEYRDEPEDEQTIGPDTDDPRDFED